MELCLKMLPFLYKIIKLKFFMPPINILPKIRGLNLLEMHYFCQKLKKWEELYAYFLSSLWES
jgi:hypothetical protein